MPRSSTHQRQRAKNYFLLVVLLLFIVGMYYFTILKESGVH